MNWQRISAWLDAHQARMTQDLRTLVQISSVSDPTSPVRPFGPGCRQVLDQMLTLGKNYGFHPENHEGYTGCLLETDGPCDIGLWGHLDEVSHGEGWIYPPKAGVIDHGYMIGRGSADNKGPVIAALYALRCLKELGIPRKYKAGVFFGVNEESGMADVDYFLSHHTPPRLSIVVDSGFPVCYGEAGFMNLRLIFRQPFSEAIQLLEAGSAPNIVPEKARAVLLIDRECPTEERIHVHTSPDGRTEILAQGVAGHTAFPQGSMNALAVLTQYLLRHIFTDESDRCDRQKLAFLNRLSASFRGEALGVTIEDGLPAPCYCIPTICSWRSGKPEFLVNIRYPSGDSGVEDPTIISEQDVISGLKAAADRQNLSLQIEKSNPPKLHLPQENPIVQTLCDVYHEKVRPEGKPFIMGGGCYARKLPNAVGFGPGPLYENWKEFLPPGHGGAHAPDECQHLESLFMQAKLYAYALCRLDDCDLIP